MKIIAFALLGLSAAACSDEADIGISSDPVTCFADGPTATVSGSARDPNNGTLFVFDNAIPTATLPPNGGAGTMLTLSSNVGLDARLLLRFGFYCAAAEVATYGVIPDDQSVQLDCPFEVASTMVGTIEFLPASEGVLIVDETANCLAGRFRVELGDNGAVSGSFSAPWQ